MSGLPASNDSGQVICAIKYQCKSYPFPDLKVD